MNDGTATQSPESTVPDTGLTIRQYYVMFGIGAFVTTIAQPAVIGRLPFSLLLKTQLHFNAETLALFTFIATFRVEREADRRHSFRLVSAAWHATASLHALRGRPWGALLVSDRCRSESVLAAPARRLRREYVHGDLEHRHGRPHGRSRTEVRDLWTDHVYPSDGSERGACQQRSARRVSRDDGVRLDRRHRHWTADRAHHRDVFRADRATGRHTGRRSITECGPSAPDVRQVEVAVGRRRVSRARLHLARLHDATALPADRHARLHPAVHRVDGDDRRRGWPRRRGAVWR